jgi:hypothetical protein
MHAPLIALRLSDLLARRPPRNVATDKSRAQREITQPALHNAPTFEFPAR